MNVTDSKQTRQVKSDVYMVHAKINRAPGPATAFEIGPGKVLGIIRTLCTDVKVISAFYIIQTYFFNSEQRSFSTCSSI